MVRRTARGRNLVGFDVARLWLHFRALMDQTAATGISRVGRVLGWGAFLGCSWTWCIGMFLPVILVRELGLWGWWVFAIPNVVGAGAMGWVLHRPGQSERMVAQHADAGAAFSVITVLFHVLFLAWVICSLIGAAPTWIAVTALAGVMAIVVTARTSAVLWLSAAVWLFSVGVFAFFFAGRPSFPAAAEFSPANALWLSPVCVFGFALCPYLDLTFHQARQANDPAQSRWAFSLGFGGCFFLMIIFTLWYSALLTPVGRRLSPSAAWLLASHLLVQTAFTLVVHGAAVRKLCRNELTRGRIGLAIGVVAGLLTLAAGPVLHQGGAMRWSAWEMSYRLFLGFYGLVFPAYVWLFIVPGSGGDVTPRPAGLVFYLAVLAVAAPFFWLGFIDQKMPYLAAGVAIVILSKLILPRVQRGPAAMPSAGR